MTPTQLRCLEFIREYRVSHGYAPTFEEIKVAMGLGSKGGVSRLIDRLVEQGVLAKEEGCARGLYLVMPDLNAVPTPVLAAELERRSQSRGSLTRG